MGGLSSDMAPCLFPVSQSLQGQDGDEASPTFVDYAQLDAFTAEAFKGNPAVVCLLPSARSKEWMQNVAAEFNAPMAAFLLVCSGNGQDTRNGTSPAAALTDSHTIGKYFQCKAHIKTPTESKFPCSISPSQNLLLHPHQEQLLPIDCHHP